MKGIHRLRSRLLRVLSRVKRPFIKRVRPFLPFFKKKGRNFLIGRIARRFGQRAARPRTARVSQLPAPALATDTENIFSWEKKLYKLNMDNIKGICCSGDQLILSDNKGGTVISKKGNLQKRIAVQGTTAVQVNNSTLAIGTAKKGVLFYDLKTGGYVDSFSTKKVPERGIAINSTNKLIAICNKKKERVRVFYSLGFADGKYLGHVVGEVNVCKPITATFDENGDLVVISEEGIFRYNSHFQKVSEYKEAFDEFPQAVAIVGEQLFVSFTSHIGMFIGGEEIKKVEETRCWAIAHAPEDNTLWSVQNGTHLLKIKL